MDSFPAGAAVRIVGLVKAAHHNGKTAVVSARSATSADRVGVTLDDGSTLSVRAANLQLVQPTHTAPQKDQAGVGPASASSGKTPKPAHAAASSQPGPVGQPKTLQMETQVLAEFDGSRDPDVMALYHHRRDMAFDAFNVSEYHAQLLDYYAKGVRVVEVVPRRIRDNLYFLVCLSHPDPTRNTLCQMAFQCRRQFLGYSMLVKQNCFVCHRPGAPKCACECASFCSSECEKGGAVDHAPVCKKIRASSVLVDTEVLQLL
jgi:hypothetical protein